MTVIHKLSSRERYLIGVAIGHDLVALNNNPPKDAEAIRMRRWLAQITELAALGHKILDYDEEDRDPTL